MKPQLPYKRTDRFGHQLQQILGEIARKYFDFSHLGFITFTRVIVSPDLRYAKIFFSVIASQTETDKIQKELNRLRKAFKKYLAPELHVKNIPDLRFFYDDTVEYQEKIEILFKSIDHETEQQ
ncbi:MAG: 30S ribosome-binding factor RbfA [FCB group bacterium]|nr:30S ribosome-binding factor RbfA [FCB group bacterium]